MEVQVEMGGILTMRVITMGKTVHRVRVHLAERYTMMAQVRVAVLKAMVVEEGADMELLVVTEEILVQAEEAEELQEVLEEMQQDLAEKETQADMDMGQEVLEHMDGNMGQEGVAD